MPIVEEVTIASDKLRATISAMGAELQRITTVDGRELQWDGDPSVWQGRAPILFPVIGVLIDGRYRLNGKSYEMPKHGFARRSLFDIVSAKAGSVLFRLSASPATHAQYPFEFQLDIGFKIVEQTLTVRALITNHDVDPMPASFGFHPAFSWPLPFGQTREEHLIRFAMNEPWPVRRIDQEGLLRADPINTPVVGNVLRLADALFIDDALIFDRLSSHSLIYGAKEGPRLQIAYGDFPTLGVWTKPGANFICIEPWHGISDPVGFDGEIWNKPGIFSIAPTGTRSMAIQIRLENQPLG